MVKTIKAVQQLNAIHRQLVQGIGQSLDWLSDGRTVYTGRLVSLTTSRRCLLLRVQTEAGLRTVRWQVSATVATAVVSMVYDWQVAA